MQLTAKFNSQDVMFGSSFKQTDSNFGAEFLPIGSGSGQDGKDGTTFIPSVSADGIISWTNDGGLPNPEPVDIKGESGTKFETDETLTLKNGILSVNTAKEPQPDNTLPITAAAVAQTVGNIEILLQTI